MDDVDLAARHVTFRYTHNALYQIFFAEVSQRLHEIRPSLGPIKISSELNYCNISAGRSGFTVGWSFPRRKGLRIELYIDTYEREQNKKAFAQLEAHKGEIEARIGAPLEWLPMLDNRASRICIAHPLDITVPPEVLAPAKIWAVDTMIKFMDTFQPYIKDLSLE